jgi:hypothetical protein
MNMKNLATIALLALSLPALAEGPTGIGKLELGLAKEEVQALSDPEEVRLDGPMTPFEYPKAAIAKFGQRPKGEEVFKARLRTSLAEAPLEATLSFEGGYLTGLHISFAGSLGTFERASKQITEKYGAGKIVDNRKEEHCIYKNGANFKLTSGYVETIWVEETSPTDGIQTTLTDASGETCPSDLRYTSPSSKYRSLSIKRVNTEGEQKPKNIF